MWLGGESIPCIKTCINKKQGHGHKDVHNSEDVDKTGHLCETEKAGRNADE